MHDAIRFTIAGFMIFQSISCSSGSNSPQLDSIYSRSDPILLISKIDLIKEYRNFSPLKNYLVNLNIKSDDYNTICIPAYYFDKEDTVFADGIIVTKGDNTPARYKTPPLGQIPKKVDRYIKIPPNGNFDHRYNISKIY